MQISRLIAARLEDSELNLTNPDSKKVDPNIFKINYKRIKSYLQGLPEGTTIGICMPKSADYMTCMLAALETGVCYVPMKYNFPESRIEQIKDVCSVKEIITQNRFQEITQIKEKVYPLKDIDEKSAAYMICTSGSTGVPKAVIISRKALSSFWGWQNNYFKNVTKDDSLLLVTEFTFDISLVDVGFFLSKGCKVFFSKFENNIFELAYELEQYKISMINTVPNNISMLLTDGVVSRIDLSHLKSLYIGGARYSYGLYEKSLKHLRDKNVYNFYGPTEATIYCTIKKLNFDKTDLNELNVTIGKMFDHLSSSFDGQELLLGGSQLMSGYNKNVKQTKKVLININGEQFYKSGDIAFKNDIGELYITGRTDDTIKYRGFRINLLDIDSYVMTIPYIQDCTTIAVPDDISENITVAYMITKEEKSVQEIKKDLEQILLPYQIPVKIEFIKSFPLNTSGKVCKKSLLELYLNKKAKK